MKDVADIFDKIQTHLWQYDREVYKAAAFGFTLKPDDSIVLLREVYNHIGKDFIHAKLPEDLR